MSVVLRGQEAAGSCAESRVPSPHFPAGRKIPPDVLRIKREVGGACRAPGQDAVGAGTGSSPWMPREVFGFGWTLKAEPKCFLTY